MGSNVSDSDWDRFIIFLSMGVVVLFLRAAVGDSRSWLTEFLMSSTVPDTLPFGLSGRMATLIFLFDSSSESLSLSLDQLFLSQLFSIGSSGLME